MLLHCPDTARRHYRDANAPKMAALAFVAYQKQLGTIDTLPKELKSTKAKCPCCANDLLITNDGGNFELKICNENEKEFLPVFGLEETVDASGDVQISGNDNVDPDNSEIEENAIPELCEYESSGSYYDVSTPSPEIGSSLKRKSTSVANFQPANLSSDNEDYTIFEDKAKNVKLMKSDLERADNDRPTTSRGGLFSLPTFENDDDSYDFSDDMDSSVERLIEENDNKKAKLLRQRYSK